MQVFAADAPQGVSPADALVGKIESLIVFPLITLFLAIAVLVFLWGAFNFVTNADDDEARKKGKRHMVFGLLGLLIMISALSILRIAAGTFGVDGPLP